jgi:serine/threonine protein kinase/tetratricopeptide (TPR) repeat protein
VNAQRWQEIQTSFDALVDLDPSERVERLATLGSVDPELQRALESLLQADAEASTDIVSGERFVSGFDSQPDPLGITGQTISHYIVREALGAGGMGVVYRADDTRLGRAVALKFLLPHYNLDASAKTRFLREAHAAAALDHPSLCNVHEVGTTDAGWLFLAMALYRGETLRSRLSREHRLGVAEALEITRQIAEGLQAAHGAGIVHRDLKPGNLMLLPDGTVRILDFGLAKARDQSLSEGTTFGTVSYMSPEQVRGTSVDGRADLWALGVVLYEMLTGVKPFTGDEDVAIALTILRDDPILLTTKRADISAALEGLVLRLLQKDPTKRYATAGELLAELPGAGNLGNGRTGGLITRWRRVRRSFKSSLPATRQLLLAGSGVAVVVIAYLVVLAMRPPPGRAPPSADPVSVSIAVVPFANVGGDSTNVPFSDGFADELTTALGRVSQLSVMARASAFTLKRKGLDAREIGRQLRVQYIVEGSVRRVANRRRVTASLINVENGREIWSEDFEHDATTGDVFTVQDSVTRSIIRHLLPHLSLVGVASSAERPTENRQAHDLYLQGRYFFEKKDSASFRRAKEYFQRAIESDSSYALAHAGLADVYSQQIVFGFAPPTTNGPKALAEASRALALDSTLVQAHISAGFIALFYEWDWVTARREFETALRLNERYAPAHLFYAWYFVATDNIDAAINEGRRAVELDPFSALDNVRLFDFLLFGRRYSDALEQGRKTFERDSTFPGLRQELAQVYVQLGRCVDAIAVLENSHDAPVGALRGVRGFTYAKCGHRAQALTELDGLRRQARDGKYVSHYSLAVIQAALGNKDEAIAELEKAETEHIWSMFEMRVEPAFLGLHADPRFVAIAREVGLGAPIVTRSSR